MDEPAQNPEDVRVEHAYTDATASENASRLAFVGLAGVRSLLTVPMLKEGTLIGAMVIYTFIARL